MRAQNTLETYSNKCTGSSGWEMRWQNYVGMYQMQTEERQPNPPTDGRPTLRTTWWTCVPIHPYWSLILRSLWSEVPTTYLEVMVLHLHLSDNQSSAHRSLRSLDNESCLAAVTKFIARRGYPSTIISDNGTHFDFRRSSEQAEIIHEWVWWS